MPRLTNPVRPFPIVTARSFAAGAVDALSLADAYWLQDDTRVDETLDEALAGLDAARARVIAIRDQRRPRRSTPIAAAVLASAALAAWFMIPDIAAASTDAATEPTALLHLNGLSLAVLILGTLVITFIPIRRRK